MLLRHPFACHVKLVKLFLQSLFHEAQPNLNVLDLVFAAVIIGGDDRLDFLDTEIFFIKPGCFIHVRCIEVFLVVSNIICLVIVTQKRFDDLRPSC